MEKEKGGSKRSAYPIMFLNLGHNERANLAIEDHEIIFLTTMNMRERERVSE